MAILTPGEMARIHRSIDREVEVDYTKQVMRVALQAIEDWIDKPGVRNSLASDIDAATAPTVLNSATKKKFFKWWMQHRFPRE